MSSVFEWDEAKRLGNIEKHGIDFLEAIEIFAYPHLTFPSPRGEEERRVSLGLIGEAVVAVVWIERGNAIRLISVRAARRNERHAYHERFGA